MAQIHKLSKWVLMTTGVLSLLIAWWSTATAMGLMIGSVTMVANIQLLARGWAPLILKGHRGALALFSTITSFIFLGVVGFCVYQYGFDGLIGFALGVFSLALVGLFHARSVEVEQAFAHVGYD